VARLPGTAEVPGWAWGPGGLVSVTRRGDELSIVCAEGRVPVEVRAERAFRALEVQGPIPFEVVGVLRALAVPLGEAGISIFAIATYDTDVILVREADLVRAAEALRGAGHEVAEV
jgi:hypothetical protein